MSMGRPRHATTPLMRKDSSGRDCPRSAESEGLARSLPMAIDHQRETVLFLFRRRLKSSMPKQRQAGAMIELDAGRKDEIGPTRSGQEPCENGTSDALAPKIRTYGYREVAASPLAPVNLDGGDQLTGRHHRPGTCPIVLCDMRQPRMRRICQSPRQLTMRKPRPIRGKMLGPKAIQ